MKRTEPEILRPIAPADEDAYRDILDRTTDEDRYCRVFHVVDHFERAGSNRCIESRADTIGFTAIDEDDTELGSAHAVAIDVITTELTIVVARDANPRGIGRALVGAVVDEVPRIGTHDLVALSLAQKYGFAKLARAFSFTLESRDALTLNWRLPIAPLRRNETAVKSSAT